MSAKGSLAKDLLDAGLDREHVDRRIRDFRREVLHEAADRLEAIDPIEFALGSIDPIAELRRMARNETPPPAT